MIDDLQWGDADSAALLADLIHIASPPTMLFLGCFRLEDVNQSRFLEILRQARDKGASLVHHHELAVEALTQAESRELALAMLGRDDARARAQAHLIARESGGNPLFIEQLVKHLQAEGSRGMLECCRTGSTSRRCSGPGSRPSRPTPSGCWRSFRPRAGPSTSRLRSGRPSWAPEVALRWARSVRRGSSGASGRPASSEIETYHDRIRETVLTHLSPESLRWHHEHLARVLESAGQADPDVLADHFLRSRRRQPGLRVSIPGRRQGHPPRWPSTRPPSSTAGPSSKTAVRPPPSAGCRRKLGDALASSGRGAEAAEAYLQAARDATAAETLELTRLASTQLLISGHVDEGLALLRTILGPLGLSMPATPQAALLSLIRHRALLRLRGLRFRARDETQVSAEDLTRIDLCWSAVAGLSVIDPILGADFQTRGLLLALRAGEPFRIARALAMEAAHRSTAGNSVRPPRRVADPVGREPGPAAGLAPGSGRDPHGSRRQRPDARPVEAGPDVVRPGRGALPQPLHRRRLGTRHRPQPGPLGPHAHGSDRRAQAPLDPADPGGSRSRRPLRGHHADHVST